MTNPSPKVIASANQILKEISRLRSQEEVCKRCDGQGERPDCDEWIMVENHKGEVEKACFACNGTGVKPVPKYAPPMRVRKAVAYSLIPLIEKSDLRSILRLAKRERERIYWPVLEDVFDKAWHKACKNKLGGA